MLQREDYELVWVLFFFPSGHVYEGLENMGLEGKEANEISTRSDRMCCTCCSGASSGGKEGAGPVTEGE